MPNDPVSVQDARRELASKIERAVEAYGPHHGLVLSVSGDEIGMLLAALRSDPARVAEEMEARLDDYEDALHSIRQWSEAYPLTIFPEPDLKKARRLLEAGGMTLDSISAYCMRHVVKGVGQIARAALRADPLPQETGESDD